MLVYFDDVKKKIEPYTKNIYTLKELKEELKKLSPNGPGFLLDVCGLGNEHHREWEREHYKNAEIIVTLHNDYVE